MDAILFSYVLGWYSNCRYSKKNTARNLKIWILNRLIFKFFQYSNSRYSDPYCICFCWICLDEKTEKYVWLLNWMLFGPLFILFFLSWFQAWARDASSPRPREVPATLPGCARTLSSSAESDKHASIESDDDSSIVADDDNNFCHVLVLYRGRYYKNIKNCCIVVTNYFPSNTFKNETKLVFAS